MLLLLGCPHPSRRDGSGSRADKRLALADFCHYNSWCWLAISAACPWPQIRMISDTITPDRKAGVNLATFDGGRFVVVLNQSGQRQIIRGVASYEQDSVLGSILKIRPSDGAEHAAELTEFILQEGIWEERILPDRQFGGDFMIELCTP